MQPPAPSAAPSTAALAKCAQCGHDAHDTACPMHVTRSPGGGLGLYSTHMVPCPCSAHVRPLDTDDARGEGIAIAKGGIVLVGTTSFPVGPFVDARLAVHAINDAHRAELNAATAKLRAERDGYQDGIVVANNAAKRRGEERDAAIARAERLDADLERSISSGERMERVARDALAICEAFGSYDPQERLRALTAVLRGIRGDVPAAKGETHKIDATRERAK